MRKLVNTHLWYIDFWALLCGVPTKRWIVKDKVGCRRRKLLDVILSSLVGYGCYTSIYDANLVVFGD
jgi:hypothetical protein